MKGQSERCRRLVALSAFAIALSVAPAAHAATFAPTDVLTDATSGLVAASGAQHDTVLESSAAASGNTIVSVAEAGRYNSGGSAAAAGWASSPDGGQTWSQGLLPGLTAASPSPGTAPRVVDMNAAYDARHATWLIGSVVLDSSLTEYRGYVSRSTDATSWSTPVLAADKVTGEASGPDKQWVACDNTATSPHYGRCYEAYAADVTASGDAIRVVHSDDGGATWSSAATTSTSGYNVQPVIQPDGTLVVVDTNLTETQVQAVSSHDGGATFGSLVTISAISRHPTGGGRNAGGLRIYNKPTVAVDAGGRIWTAWADCSFRSGCGSSDVVYSTSTDGTTWSSTTRVPIGSVSGPEEYASPSIAIDPASGGTAPRVAISFQYLPSSSCTGGACTIGRSLVESPDGGASWTARQELSAPIAASAFPLTPQGRMPGNYDGTVFVNGGTAVATFGHAAAPSASTFHVALGASRAPLVSADFTASCPSSSCSFDASASSSLNGPITKYAWDFGDGSTSTDASPTHAFSAATTVRLTVTDSAGATGTVARSVTPGATTPASTPGSPAPAPPAAPMPATPTPAPPTVKPAPTTPKKAIVRCKLGRTRHGRRTVSCTLSKAVKAKTKVKLLRAGRTVATGTASGRKVSVSGVAKRLKSGTVTIVLRQPKAKTSTKVSAKLA